MDKFICQKCGGEVYFYVITEHSSFNKKEFLEATKTEDFGNLYLTLDVIIADELGLDSGECICTDKPTLSNTDIEMLEEYFGIPVNEIKII